MALEKGMRYLESIGMAGRVKLFEGSTATVEEAAAQLCTEPARIAKTLAFRNAGRNGCIILVAAGDARIDNKRFKQTFGMKAAMCSPEETLDYTGHAVGGVCPFGIPEDIPVYTDVSLRRFDTVYPAAGDAHSAVRLTPVELFDAARAAEWVDVCKLPE